MKMEIDIEAPCAGTITAVAVKQNDAVEEGQTIVVIG
jgi:biotin carboxyl carrier protein